MSLSNSLIDDQDFRTLADLLPDFIGRYDVEGRVRYYNVQLRKALGVELTQVLGRKTTEVWLDGRFAEYEKKIQNCGTTGNPDYLDLTVPDFNGNKIEYHHIRFVAERNVKGDIVGVIAFGRDMTDRILLEQKLTANSRMASLGEMAGGIAHEINNPLSIIIGKCEAADAMVRRKLFSEGKAMAIIHDIRSTAGRIDRIIKGLRNFSREGDQDPFVTEQIQSIVNDSLAFCEQKIINNSIELMNSVNNCALVMIQCRPTQISQVIVNLLSNASDAIVGTVSPWIKIELKNLEDKIELSITDSGSGISKDIRAKIMQPFFTTKPIGQGTGLGLSVSRGIIESHKGTLQIDEQSKNTRFVVTLPKKQ